MPWLYISYVNCCTLSSNTFSQTSTWLWWVQNINMLNVISEQKETPETKQFSKRFFLFFIKTFSKCIIKSILLFSIKWPEQKIHIKDFLQAELLTMIPLNRKHNTNVKEFKFIWVCTFVQFILSPWSISVCVVCFKEEIHKASTLCGLVAYWDTDQ